MHRISFLLIASFFFFSNTAAAAQADSGLLVQLKNQYSGKCLSVKGGSKVHGAALVHKECGTGSLDAIWEMRPEGGGYRIANRNSGLCLGVAHQSKSDGSQVTQVAPCDRGDTVWRIEAVPPGTSPSQPSAVDFGRPSVIRNNNSNKCLALVTGDEIKQYGCPPHRPKTTWTFVEMPNALPENALKRRAPADPMANGITVLTYNTHLFGGSSAEVGNYLKNDFPRLFTRTLYERSDPLVFKDDSRAKLIVERIRECGADIVGLQEVWAYQRQGWICDQLADSYPYRYHPPDVQLDPRVIALARGVSDPAGLLTGLTGLLATGKTTSGLVLLSKYKLTNVTFSPFPARTDPGEEEFWARKGVITATVELWDGGPTFRLGISHACTDVGGKQQPDIKQIAQMTTAGPGSGVSRVSDSPAIMMGDFNVNGVKPEAYELMKGLFGQVDAMDAYRHVHPEIGEGDHTANVWSNLLYQLFNPRKGPTSRPPDILDYMFLKNSGGGLRMTPLEAEVIRDWKSPMNRGWWLDIYADKWASNYVAVVSFQLNGHPYLFGLKTNDTAYISRINDDGKGWKDIHQGQWASNYVGTAITTFYLNGHPHIFALKRWPSNTAYISRINDDGKGWKDIYHGQWASNYVAVVSFQLNGHPYMFGLKTNNTAYISRINDDGRGWKDIYQGKWASSYVGTAITTFYLNGHPYIFALKKNNTAYISRINDDGKGWKDIYRGQWASNYVAVRSFELNGHPYLFGLKTNDTAYVSRINDDGRGWKDIYRGGWSSHYTGTAITTFDLEIPDQDGKRVILPHMFSLKKEPYDQGWISRFGDYTNTMMDLSDHYPIKIKFEVTRTAQASR